MRYYRTMLVQLLLFIHSLGEESHGDTGTGMRRGRGEKELTY